MLTGPEGRAREDIVKISFKERRCKSADWIHSIQWLTSVDTVMNLWVV